MRGSALPPRGRMLVTGCAGFLGSRLSERLIAAGHAVLGVDCFRPYYSRAVKERNLARLLDERRFSLLELDLASAPLDGLLEGVDAAFHLAAQPGVRGSFGDGFERYVRDNVLATQRILEQGARSPLQVLVYASSSSVYGDAAEYPTTEASRRRPVSPYGMTKVATEELAAVYARCFGVPLVGLRYFTVYGPRQRPDMALARFLTCALEGRPLPINGDGHQVRDFTFVEDAVSATLAAAERGRSGAVYNVGGGSPVKLRDAIRLVGELTGKALELDHRPAMVGDAGRTGCSGELACRDLGFEPRTELRDGLAAQLEWMLGDRRRRAEAVAA